MTEQEQVGVRRMIQDTISRLQRASTNRHHMGAKYSRLLHMLWRATPSKDDRNAMASPEAQHGAFSWLDLDAVGNFATHNNSTTASVTDFDDLIGDLNNPVNMTLFTDYRWLSDDNMNMIF